MHRATSVAICAFSPTGIRSTFCPRGGVCGLTSGCVVQILNPSSARSWRTSSKSPLFVAQSMIASSACIFARACSRIPLISGSGVARIITLLSSTALSISSGSVPFSMTMTRCTLSLTASTKRFPHTPSPPNTTTVRPCIMLKSGLSACI